MERWRSAWCSWCSLRSQRSLCSSQTRPCSRGPRGDCRSVGLPSARQRSPAPNAVEKLERRQRARCDAAGTAPGRRRAGRGSRRPVWHGHACSWSSPAHGRLRGSTGRARPGDARNVSRRERDFRPDLTRAARQMLARCMVRPPADLLSPHGEVDTWTHTCSNRPWLTTSTTTVVVSIPSTRSVNLLQRRTLPASRRGPAVGGGSRGAEDEHQCCVAAEWLRRLFAEWFPMSPDTCSDVLVASAYERCAVVGSAVQSAAHFNADDVAVPDRFIKKVTHSLAGGGFLA